MCRCLARPAVPMEIPTKHNLGWQKFQRTRSLPELPLVVPAYRFRYECLHRLDSGTRLFPFYLEDDGWTIWNVRTQKQFQFGT